MWASRPSDPAPLLPPLDAYAPSSYLAVQVKRKGPNAPASNSLLADVFSLKFLHLWTMILLSAVSGLNIASSYKTYGTKQPQLNSDAFLSLVGSLSAILGNAAGRFFWGSMSDTHGFKQCFMALTGIQAAIMLLYQKLAGSRTMFTLATVLMLFCMGGNFAMFPAQTFRVFGANGPSVYSILFTGELHNTACPHTQAAKCPTEAQSATPHIRGEMDHVLQGLAVQLSWDLSFQLICWLKAATLSCTTPLARSRWSRLPSQARSKSDYTPCHARVMQAASHDDQPRIAFPLPVEHPMLVQAKVILHNLLFGTTCEVRHNLMLRCAYCMIPKEPQSGHTVLHGERCR